MYHKSRQFEMFNKNFIWWSRRHSKAATNSEEIGHINITSVSDTTLKIEYHVNAGHEMCELSFSYGTSKNSITNNYSKQFAPPTSTYSFEIEKQLPAANIYMDSTVEFKADK